MKIYQSAEDYLETILILNRRLDKVRSIDIVKELQYSRPSVSVAMKNLRENGYIDVDAEGHITLTEKGREIAESIYERHTFISDLLVGLGVDADIASQDACQMEHVISPESFNAIKQYVLNDMHSEHTDRKASK